MLTRNRLFRRERSKMEQTHRHSCISRLLRLQSVIFCVNKMDLVNYDQDVFLKIATDINSMVNEFEITNQNISIIPISSLKGDNVVHVSQSMNWLKGETLSTVLHAFAKKVEDTKPFRMDVQQVYHVQNEEFIDYRSYAGRISSGILKVGDELTVLPSGKTSVVVEIRKFTETLAEATTNDSIQIRLRDDIDISRGMLLAKETTPFLFEKELNAKIVWLDEKPANLGAKYTIQAGSRTAFCKIQTVSHLIQPENPLEILESNTIELNAIAVIQLKLATPIFLDKFTDNKANSAFILIDSQTNNTVAVGFVE